MIIFALNTRHRRPMVLMILAMLIMALASSALAAPLDPSGDLDTGYDTDGKASVNFREVASFSEARAVALQSTGKIVVGGSSVEGGDITHFALVRLNNNGTQDTSFGNGGSTKLAIGSYDLANDIAVYPADNNAATTHDNKIVVVGFSSMPTTGNDTSVARFTADGTIDPSFAGSGYATINLGTSTDQLDRANAVAIQDDGKIVIAGYSRSPFTNANGTISTNDDVAIVRFNANGTLDTTFGTGGKIIKPIATGRGRDISYDVVIVGTGDSRKILVGGSTTEPVAGSPPQVLMLQYNTNGTPDTTFGGGDGIAVVDIPGNSCMAGYSCGESIRGMALSGNKIVVTGTWVTWGMFPSTASNPKTNMLTARFNADGTLDTTFDADGYVITQVARGFYTDIGESVAVQPDGKIVSFGWTDQSDDMGAVADPNMKFDHDFLFVRFNTNGTYDSTFDGDGIKTVELKYDGLTYDDGDAMAIDSSGKIIGVGMRTSQSTTTSDSYIGVARLNTNGSVDSTFGPDVDPQNGVPDGYFYTQLIGGSRDEVGGMAIDAAGNAVVAGYTDNGETYDFGVARFKPNGALDPTFNGDGLVNADNATKQDTARAVAIQSNGSIVVVGDSYGGIGTPSFTLMRFGSTGNLDTTFDGDGIATTTFGTNGNQANAVAIDSSSRVVVGGTVSDSPGNWDFGLARFNTNGTLDTTFGSSGKVRLDLGTGQNFDEIQAIAIQGDGKIVIAGRSSSDSQSRAALARINTNGTLDTTFGSGGSVIVRLSDTSLQYAGDLLRGLAILPDGKIIVGGKALVNQNGMGYNAFTLARFNSNGTLDSTYGTSGKVWLNFATNQMDEIYGIARQYDDKIVAFGYAGLDWGLARFNWDDGSLDTTYGVNGLVTTDFGGFDRAEGIAVLPDGKAIGAGTRGGNDFATAQYLGDPLPTMPSAPDLVVGSDSGRSTTDNITNDNTPSFGGTCVTGETVVLTIGGAETAPRSRVRCVNGTYTVTSAVAVPDGTRVFRVLAENGAGATAASAPLSIVIDTIAAPPTISTPVNGSDVLPNPTISGSGAEVSADVTVRERTNTVCTATAIAGGGWSCASTLVPASYTIAVTQSDIAGNTSLPTTQTFRVRAPTTTTLSANAAPTVYGQPVTFSAAVSSEYGIPNGVVQFVVDGGAPTSATLSAQGVATLTLSNLSVGNHTVSAQYEGAPLYFPSTAASLAHTVNKANTSTAITSAANPSVFGQSVVWTVAVQAAAPGAGVPAGMVTFKQGSTTISAVALDNTGRATLAMPSSSVGEYAITVEYGGNTNFIASTSPSLTQVVNKANTTSTVSSSANPAGLGQPVTFTAAVQVVAPGAGMPSGTVTFKAGTTTIGTATLNNLGRATITTANLSVGSNAITVEYAGDASFSASTSAVLTQTINKSATTSTITSAANPSVFGQGVNLTAVVNTPTNLYVPSGMVTFKAGSTTIGTATLDSSGQATLSVATLPVGSSTLTVEYAGDANFTASTSASLTQAVDKATTATTVTSSANPSALGQAVTFTADVQALAPGAGTPSGTVTFKTGSTTIGSATLDSSGQATVTTKDLNAGEYAIIVEYAGDANFTASTSSTHNHVVTTPVDLSVTNHASTSRMTSAGTLVYTVTVTNRGTVNASNVMLRIKLPSSGTLTNLPTGCADANGEVECSLGSMAASSTMTHTFNLSVPTSTRGGTMLTADATVTSGAPDENITDNTSETSTIFMLYRFHLPMIG